MKTPERKQIDKEWAMGSMIAKALMLKTNRAGFYRTTSGTKSELGLYRTVKELIEDDA